MGLKAKFNLVLLAAFLAGLALAAAMSWRIVHENARREVLQEAAIMMAQAVAVRDYTTDEIAPLLAEQLKVRFLPQSIPFFAAQSVLRSMAKEFPAYTYKEAALNPTNPADRATDWEAGIVGTFGQTPTLAQLTTTRDTPDGPVLSFSRPIRVTDKSCLGCHSTPAAAPQSMIDLYGSANGFDWKLGDVVGAQIVSVPMSVALQRADAAFKYYLGGLAAVFVVIFVLLNLLLHFVIVKPIRTMSAIASEISLGNMGAPEFEVRGRDEIASLSESFNRMRRSLANAMKMLES
jgi:HAMP domain-containing protein